MAVLVEIIDKIIWTQKNILLAEESHYWEQNKDTHEAQILNGKIILYKLQTHLFLGEKKKKKKW